jgi:hypothetical protein
MLRQGSCVINMHCKHQKLILASQKSMLFSLHHYIILWYKSLYLFGNILRYTMYMYVVTCCSNTIIICGRHSSTFWLIN